MDEAPRHKKKATRGNFPVYYRLDKRNPKSNYFFQCFEREWSVHGWYEDEETAATACSALNMESDIFEYSTEGKCTTKNE